MSGDTGNLLGKFSKVGSEKTTRASRPIFWQLEQPFSNIVVGTLKIIEKTTVI